MIRIPDRLIAAMRDHARETYNEECCGVLFGKDDGGVRSVEAIDALPNSRNGERHRRFLITPEDYRRAEAEARKRGLDLLGFYHSHPDHPARPSEYDLNHAWPFFSYVILAVDAGAPGETRSYVMSEDRSRFTEEPLVSGG